MRGKRQSSSKRTRARRKAYWPDVTLSLGCYLCSLRGPCGGLHDQSRRMNCFDDCCGKADCDVVCPRNPDFARRVEEIGGFEFPNLTEKAPSQPAVLPAAMPIIYHGYRRRTPLRVGHAALPLFRVLSRHDGLPMHQSPESLRESFLVAEDTQLFLSGVDRDAPLERFWALGRSQRREVFARLRDLGISGVSTPNFSTFTDVPRPDALHALVRIARIFDEMQAAGMPAVLHLNGMFERDYERLAEWIARHPGVTHVAAEFGTGLKAEDRGALHVGWLADLAAHVGRPLHLVVRGGFSHLPALAGAFSGVTVLETNSFSKTMYRQEAMLTSNAELGWRTRVSAANEPLDDLLAANVFLQTSVLVDALGGRRRAA